MMTMVSWESFLDGYSKGIWRGEVDGFFSRREIPAAVS
jgi:hypothetical protein